jgi:hypothetical protein
MRELNGALDDWEKYQSFSIEELREDEQCNT